MTTFIVVVLVLFGAALIFVGLLVRAGLRSQPAPATELVFVDERDHSEEELMEIFSLHREDGLYAYGRARFETLEEAIAYARTVPAGSRPKRR